MKKEKVIYVAERGYKDLELGRHVDKDEILEEAYQKAGVKLTKKRIEYLVEERKLYIPVADDVEISLTNDTIDVKDTDDKAEENKIVNEEQNVIEEQLENKEENQ